jgi:hypothetical protein
VKTWTALILFVPVCTSACGESPPGDDTSTGLTNTSTADHASTGTSGGDLPTGEPGTTGDPPTSEPVTSTTDAPVTTTNADTSTGDTSTGEPGEAYELLVCSFFGDAVGRFDLETGAFLGDLGPAMDLDGALGITVGPDGDIYVASEEANMILRFAGATGAFVDRFVWDDPMTAKDETGGLSGPGAVLFGPDGQLYFSSFDCDAILRYDGASGAFVDVFVPANSGGLDGPDAGMAFGPDGHLYVPGYYSDSIPRFDGATGAPLGDFTPAQGNKLDHPRTLVFRGEHLYVANEGSNEVLRYDADSGAFVDVFVAAGAGGLMAPAGMVFGPDGVLHVASADNMILRYDADGAPLPTIVDAIAGKISGPTHITLAPAQP